jgi:hypothetical protein
MRRTLISAVASWLLAGGAATAQTYPLFADSAHRSTAPPYPQQGPLPIEQQAEPLITPGQPLLTAPGVPNGPPVTILGPGADRPRRGEVAPRPAPVGRAPLVVDPARLHFVPSPVLPSSARIAPVKLLPGGGLEAYLRIAPGTSLPQNWSEGSADLTVLGGTAVILVQGEQRLAPQGSVAHVPAGVAHAVVCSADEPCLVLMRSDGPWRPHYLEGPLP